MFISRKRYSTLIELPVVSKRAFTLIELLVTIALIILMAAIAIPAFSRYSAMQELDSTAEEIATKIETMHNSSHSPVQGQTISVAEIYTMASADSKSNSLQTYQGTYTVSNGIKIPAANESTSDNLTMPSNLEINQVEDNLPEFHIYFVSPETVEFTNNLTSFKFTLTSKRISNKYQFTITDNPFQINYSRD